MKVYVGKAKLIGPISRYAGRFNFLEVGAEPGRCPRPAVLRQWRGFVPKEFVFSVRLARAVGAFDSGAEEAIAFGLKAAEALDARWLLVQTPASFGPGQRNRDRLKKLFERLLLSGRHVAWDPRGVWEEAEVLPLISEVDVQWARDASRYEMVEEQLAYVRIPALGTAARVGLGLAERAGENLRGFEEAYVVIEGEGAGRAVQIIREIANQPVGDGELVGDDGVEELHEGKHHRGSVAGGHDDEFEDDEFEADDSEVPDSQDDDNDDDDGSDGIGDDDDDDDDDEDDEPDEPEDPEMLKPDIIDDSDLPWAPGKKGKSSR